MMIEEFEQRTGYFPSSLECEHIPADPPRRLHLPAL